MWFGDQTKQALSAAEVKLTGRRFCTTCQRTQHATGGTQRGARWICQPCVDRTAAWKKANGS